MTATAPAAPESMAGERPRPGHDLGARRLWHSVRVPAALVFALLLVGILLSLGGEQFPSGHLEPDNPEPGGARALARLLGEDSEVTVARDSASAARAVERAGEDTVLMVFLDHRLLPEELATLSELGTDTVLVQPSLRSLKAFAPGTDVTGRTEDEESLEPECTLPATDSAGSAEVGGELYSASEDVVAQACYPSEDGSALMRVDSPHGGTTTVVGTGAFLSNRDLDADGNAALALNLASAENVVWLRPDVPEEVGGSDIVDLLPGGLLWSAVPLVLTLSLLALWRGRRMGALVHESLPVVVRASETTEGRAGLYRSRNARDRVAAALRNGFLERSVPKLGLNADSGAQTVVATLAARTGDDPRHLEQLLYPGPNDPYVADDGAMLGLGEALDELTRKLR
ncbi:DUF4350 domain-containing protein [Nocardiopsis listeri]|uniref:DUF4350 domain-containing protein n=1 Tax=Nocardiopsis listeri TaxID=53440 RepID=UPI00082C103C|nr:DUF4350 domain-containing protein [Nocardiopsis listeri]